MTALTYNGQFEAELKKIVKQTLDEATHNLSTGASGTFEHYREQVGFIRALGMIDEMCAEANTAVDKR